MKNIRDFQNEVSLELLGAQYDQISSECTDSTILSINRKAAERYMKYCNENSLKAEAHRTSEVPFHDTKYVDAQCNYMSSIGSSIYTHADHNTLS